MVKFTAEAHIFQLPLSFGSTTGSLQMQWSNAEPPQSLKHTDTAADTDHATNIQTNSNMFMEFWELNRTYSHGA